MLRAATGERVARRRVGVAGGDIRGAVRDGDGDGPAGLLAVVGSVGFALLAMVVALVVIQSAMTDVSDLFAPSTVHPAPSVTAAR